MKMMNERMARICRGAISSVAGVDNQTMAAVIAMRMKSAAYVEEGLVNTLMDERAKAAEDYSF